MTTKSIKLVAFIFLLIHGIGHFQGVVAAFGVKINNANPSTSWILKSFSDQINRNVCLIIFLLAGILGILTALSFKGMFVPSDYWQSLAIVTAVFSTLCLVMYPNGFAMFFNKVGAIAVNLLIYYSIVFSQNWPSVLFED